MNKLENRLNDLKKYIKNLKSVAVAYSSGVDSTFLLKTAHDELKENVIAFTINSCLFTEKELNEAVTFCKKEKIKHIIIDVDVFNIDGFKDNPKDRCYFCKREIFKKIIESAKKFGTENIIEGSNVDDAGDYRPGMKALSELEILSPLKAVGLNKAEIRKLSEKLNLKSFNKPSMACLASRIPYGEEITKNKLKMIEKAEDFLFKQGFKQLRVRIHGNSLARIEVNRDDFQKIRKIQDMIIKEFKKLGFQYVSLDLEGFRSGSMNEVL